jgi:hypothetical protein
MDDQDDYTSVLADFLASTTVYLEEPLPDSSGYELLAVGKRSQFRLLKKRSRTPSAESTSATSSEVTETPTPPRPLNFSRLSPVEQLLVASELIGGPAQLHKHTGKSVVVTRETTDNNHFKLAKQLADECRLALVVEDYTKANDLVVKQWMRMKMRDIPSLRKSHQLKIIGLAVVMVFTPTADDVETSVLMNTKAVMDRRFEMERTKHSRIGGIFGWFTGRRRVEGPSASR